jgi:hypothetical protein
MSNNNGTGIEGVIRVCINETDLISRDFYDCHECALACAIKRTTGKLPYVSVFHAWLSDSVIQRDAFDDVQYELYPHFNEEKYQELRAKAMNREKVFHYIDLIPSKK